MDNNEYSELNNNYKLLTETIINNRQRIDILEKEWLRRKFRYNIVDFFLIFYGLDFLIKSIFGIGIFGIAIIVYNSIAALF